jgi:hypothetical protein
MILFLQDRSTDFRLAEVQQPNIVQTPASRMRLSACRAKDRSFDSVPTENSIPARKCPRVAYITMLHARLGEQPVGPVCC